jgi:hypothetical protein
MSRQGYLLLRRAGGLFGVANADVVGLSRRGGIYRIEVRQGGLLADEVVGVVEDLDVHPMAPIVGLYWAEPVSGWAVHAGSPVVVVDSGRLPHALEEGESLYGE